MTLGYKTSSLIVTLKYFIKSNNLTPKTIPPYGPSRDQNHQVYEFLLGLTG